MFLLGFFSFFKVDVGESFVLHMFLVEFLCKSVVCAIITSLSLGAIWLEDTIVDALSFDKDMFNCISFVI